MAYIPQVDSNIPLSGVNPLDMEAKGFALGQRQLEAQRETQQYNQAQQQQRALSDIFQKADMSTPEGQQDVIRQVYKVNPQLGAQMTSQKQEADLKAAQKADALSKAAHNQALTEQEQVAVVTEWQGEAANTLGSALQQAKGKAGTALPGTPQYNDALNLANDEIDKASKQWRIKYQGSKSVQELLDKVDDHDFHSLQDLEEKAKLMQDAVRKSAAAQAQKLPDAYQPNPQKPGELMPTPGGPHDPKVVAQLAAARTAAETKAKEGQWGAREGEILAAMTEAGVSMPSGLRSKEQIHATLKGLEERYPNASATEIAEKIKSGKIELTALTKEASVAGTQVGKVGLAIHELDEFAPAALDASSKVPRGSFVPINKLMNMYKEGAVQDPNLRRLALYTNFIMNAYDQLAGRGGTDVAKREHARKLLMESDSPETYKAAIETIQAEGRLAKKAGEEAISDASGRKSGGKKEDPLGIR